MNTDKLSALAKQLYGMIPREGMRFLKYSFVLVLFGLLGCTKGPITYTAPDGQFSILMPGQPVIMGGGESGFVHSLAAEGRGAIYFLVYEDYASSPSNPESLFSAQRDRELQNAPGDIATDHAISLGAYPGREVEVRFPDGVMGRTRYFLVGRRLYEVRVFGRPESEFVNRYFESFVVHKSPEEDNLKSEAHNNHKQ
jgi:hypothetical protein